MQIVDGKVTNCKYGRHFNVQLSEGVNPSICPTVNFEGMPVALLMQLVWDSYKVRARQATLKGFSTAEELIKAYGKGEVAYDELLSKERMQYARSIETMNKDELEAEIARLQAKVAEKNE